MSKFNFSTTHTRTLGHIRVSEITHHKIKSIAAQKQVTMQEVVRVLLDVGLEEFEKEYSHHFDVSPHNPPKNSRLDGSDG